LGGPSEEMRDKKVVAIGSRRGGGGLPSPQSGLQRGHGSQLEVGIKSIDEWVREQRSEAI